jgi:hypothetical protein
MLPARDYLMFFDICLKYPAKKPIVCRKTKIWGDWRTQFNSPQNYDILKQMF